MESNDAAQQSIEKLKATIIELDKLIAESLDNKEISELKELRDKLFEIVESFDGKA